MRKTVNPFIKDRLIKGFMANGGSDLPPEEIPKKLCYYLLYTILRNLDGAFCEGEDSREVVEAFLFLQSELKKINPAAFGL